MTLLAIVAATVMVTRGGSEDGLGSWRLRKGTALSFDLPALAASNGPRIDLAQFRGTPVVVNVFASTCAPCVEELPRFQAAATRHRGNLHVIGVDFLDERSAGLALVRRTGVRFPVAFDQQGTLATTWRLSGLPGTIFLDREGRLVAQVRGTISATELDRRIGSLIR